MTSEKMTREVERPPGRPRSEEAHRAILDAAVDLFLERGLEGMSIEGVAAKAGVGKTTIYRRWESKEDLIVAAIDEVIFHVETKDAGSLRDDLIDVAVNVQTIFGSPIGGRMFARMVPHVVADTPLGRAHRERIIGPRFARLDGIVARGIERGELRPDVNPEMIRALMVGPVFVWMLMHQLTQRGIKKRAEELVDSILPGLLA